MTVVALTTATPVPEPSVTTSAIPDYGSRFPIARYPVDRIHLVMKQFTVTGQHPSPSHSTTTSPASSAPLRMPISLENSTAQLHGVDTSPSFTLVKTEHLDSGCTELFGLLNTVRSIWTLFIAHLFSWLTEPLYL